MTTMTAPAYDRSTSDDELFLARLLGTCPDSIYVFDLERRQATFRTRPLYQVLGYDEVEIEAPDAIVPQQLLHPDDHVDVESLLASIARLDDGQHLDINFRLRPKTGGWRHFRSRIAPLRRNRHRITSFVGVIADTTVEHTAQAALRQAREQAEAANAAKTRFLADMSHEIRTPLHTLTGAFELLGRSGLDGRQAQLVQTAQRAGEMLIALINDALDIAAIEAGELRLHRESFSVSELIAQLAQDFGPRAATKGLGLATSIRPGVPELISGDLRRIRQMLGNLVGNAVKFTEKGCIQLWVAASPLAKGRMTVRFGVTDTGPGLSDELGARLFQRFARGDHAGGPILGSGLGLSIVADLARAMGGAVAVRSAPGEGATFWFDVPLDQAPDLPSSAAPTPLTSATSDDAPTHDVAVPVHSLTDMPRSNAVVLIVDDSPDNRFTTQRLLTACGVTPIAAEDGETAIRLVASHAPHLIFMDCQMPGLDGIETVRRLRAAGCHVPVVGLTANITAATHAACLAAGFDDVITKPLRLAQLKSQLGDRLRSEAADSEEEDL